MYFFCGFLGCKGDVFRQLTKPLSLFLNMCLMLPAWLQYKHCNSFLYLPCVFINSLFIVPLAVSKILSKHRKMNRKCPKFVKTKNSAMQRELKAKNRTSIMYIVQVLYDIDWLIDGTLSSIRLYIACLYYTALYKISHPKQLLYVHSWVLLLQELQDEIVSSWT